MFDRLPFIAFFVLCLFLSTLFTLSYYQHRQVTFPANPDNFAFGQVLGQKTYIGAGAPTKKLGLVYGFLPYWNTSGYQLNPVITHLAYFRLAVTSKGELAGAGDGGYNLLQKEDTLALLDQAKRQNIKLEFTFFSSLSDDIAALLACSACQDQLIATINHIVTTYGLDGVNLDFEYVGTVSQAQRDTFTNFVYRLRTLLDSQHPRTKLSIDVYGGAASMENLWDFPSLAKIIDRVIVMGYDYKTRRSTTPGPTAPTLGKDVLGGDIWEDIRSLMSSLPADKIVLAIPFYGYAWETTTGQLNTAQAYPDSGQTLTYRGARLLLADRHKNVKEFWDERSLTPYLTYYDPEVDRWTIGFFENPRSLGYKIDLVEKLGLGGIAIWALGYEGDYQELWDTISERF